MVYSDSSKKWKQCLNTWNQEFEGTEDAKLNVTRNFNKYKHLLSDYERLKTLIEKAKLQIITEIESQELRVRIGDFNDFSMLEIYEIMDLFKKLSSVHNPETNPNKKIKKPKLKLSLYQRVTIPKPFMVFHRNKAKLSKNPLINRFSIKKAIKSRKVQALSLITIIMLGFLINIYFIANQSHIEANFKSNIYKADVDEPIIFSWSVFGSFSNGAIIFGDGYSIELNETSNAIKHSYSVQGKYNPIIHVWNRFGYSYSKVIAVEIKNETPQFEVSMVNSAYEDELVKVSIVNIIESQVDLKDEILKYVYDFADNNKTTSHRHSIVHRWEKAGLYPMTITIFDDQGALTQKTEYIEIINKIPEASFDYSIKEKGIEFNAELSIDTIGDYNSLMYIWDFGDNHTAFGKYVNHAYNTSGQYIIELCVKDDNGAVDLISRLITIDDGQLNLIEKKETEKLVDLDILGPFTLPQNIEGQMVNLDVEIYDSLGNEPTLSYTWYDENRIQISTDKRPSIVLDDGDYHFTLNVSNQNGKSISENISMKVNNIAPEVFVSNYVYNGPNTGEILELNAYGYDSILDINSMKFYWEITNGKITYTYGDTVGKAASTMIFTCTETSIYRGQVKVVDPSGMESVATFFVNVIVDNNKNSVPDNIEQLLEYTSESIESFSDADNDYISDQCEQFILNTNFVNPDTDGDGLFDGLDSSGIGELSIGTNPLNEDTDYDLLKDSTEFYGWNVSINFFDGSKTLHTSSEPLRYDTDYDGVSDYIEYEIGSNPRLRDSDGDGLEDLLDPFPTNFDNDADFLSDKIELDIGTELNNTDSDGDGIKDGEEFYGWGLLGFKTNPLNPDCDRDFASDGAEMKFYTKQLENSEKNEIRVNVSNPVSLHFPYMFQNAATAQISVALSFGEHGTNQIGEYGIEDNNVKNLTVRIKHEGYDALLFET
ncbi:MAG: PKD domain-containing protein, partial [Candidatus Lokiarchaeota archaeon]|nr:PKD domain-containing protein [Candidatus Lokiarchaeota archaeon]